MMALAEHIIHEKYPTIEKLAVTAGVGVRGYYEKLGYREGDEYMVKNLTQVKNPLSCEPI